MSKKQRLHGNSATDKEREDTKHQPKNGVIDGVGGMGGSSGAGGERARVDHIGEISGIDVKLYPGEIPTPGSAGRGAHSARHAGHSEGGMSGKNRGSSAEKEPSCSDDESKQ